MDVKELFHRKGISIKDWASARGLSSNYTAQVARECFDDYMRTYPERRPKFFRGQKLLIIQALENQIAQWKEMNVT